MKSKIVVIGLGNDYRSDDRVGLEVARMLSAMNFPNIEVVEGVVDSISLMEHWKDAKSVILVDAVASSGKPGTIYKFDVHQNSIPKKSFRSSTHALGVAEAIELARVLDQLPAKFIIYGIEGETFSIGDHLSPIVRDSVQKVLKEIIDSF